MNLLRKMLVEEWRMHARLFSGRSFAMFPVTLFLITFGFTHMTVTYSTLPAADINPGLLVIGVFMGAAVGTIGFTSRSAFRNVLGPVNLLLYSSRTLPVSERRLLATFLVKDIVYYVALFLAPIALGVFIPAGLAVLSGIVWMFGGFAAMLLVSAAIARSSVHLPSLPGTGYGHGALSPLADKSLVDVSRSAGGLFKVVFTLLVLTGAYWFFVTYFPVMRVFLNRPLLSYSALIGTLALSVYNWINRFDAAGDYTYLPIDARTLLHAKEEAFLVVATPLVALFILGAALIHPGSIVLALATGFATLVYTLGVAVTLLGLEPNTRMYDARVFLAYLVANGIVIVPLLALSALYTPQLMAVYLGVLGLALATGLGLIFRS